MIRGDGGLSRGGSSNCDCSGVGVPGVETRDVGIEELMDVRLGLCGDVGREEMGEDVALKLVFDVDGD